MLYFTYIVFTIIHMYMYINYRYTAKCNPVDHLNVADIKWASYVS